MFIKQDKITCTLSLVAVPKTFNLQYLIIFIFLFVISPFFPFFLSFGGVGVDNEFLKKASFVASKLVVVFLLYGSHSASYRHVLKG